MEPESDHHCATDILAHNGATAQNGPRGLKKSRGTPSVNSDAAVPQTGHDECSQLDVAQSFRFISRIFRWVSTVEPV